MTSIVSICNLALANIGAASINDLSEASTEARACNRFYEHCRDMLLQAYPWHFAAKTAVLVELATNDKTGRWGHAYTLPSDYLKARYIRPEYKERPYPGLPETIPPDIYGWPYEIEGPKVYCNLEKAHLRYTYRLTDPTRFSPLFVEALAWHLTTRITMPLTRDPRMRQANYQVAMQAQNMAEAADANDQRETTNHDTEFVTGRDSYGDWYWENGAWWHRHD